VVGRLPRPGLVLLVGVTHTDTPALAAQLARKIWDLRILERAAGGAETPAEPPGETPAEPAPGSWSRGDVSCSDVGAPLLVVSQFTLYADIRKGRRPSWSQAAPAAVAAPLIDHLVASLRDLGAHVETGIFGAMMEVDLVNTGPVTIVLQAEA
jgi:D-tyrosyl-tRNA(Tyr) deacylase